MSDDENFDTPAAEAQPAPAPIVTLELNVNELNIVIAGMQELPHRVVDGLIRKLVEQAQAQLQG